MGLPKQIGKITQVKGGTNISSTEVNGIATVNQTHFYGIQIHSWYDTDANQVYVPFGPSQVESSSTSDSVNDDTLFIPPYDGELVKMMVHLAPGSFIMGGAGAVRISLRVNGSNLMYEDEDVLHETTKVFTWSDNNTFSAGDRVRISFDPGNNPKNCTMTSVWKYTL
jgi:hypothetical protein